MDSKLNTAVEETARATARELECTQRALLGATAPEGWRVRTICTLESALTGLIQWLHRPRADTADSALVGLRLIVGAQKHMEEIKADIDMWKATPGEE